MGRTNTDIDVIKTEINFLKEVLCDAEERRQALRGKRPEGTKQKGNVYNKLLETESIINDEWDAYMQLVRRTLEFLGDSSTAYEQSDMQGKSQIENK